jgi:predicted nuclease of predicted toxin-antitoxin system
MGRFLVDEDMPRSTSVVLREAGHEVEDVRDAGLRGCTDEEVIAYARARGAVLITADKGFANILRFPPGTHAGILVLRMPNELSVPELNRRLLQVLMRMEGEDLRGLLIIVEPHRIRIRRPASDPW